MKIKLSNDEMSGSKSEVRTNFITGLFKENENFNFDFLKTNTVSLEEVQRVALTILKGYPLKPLNVFCYFDKEKGVVMECADIGTENLIQCLAYLYKSEITNNAENFEVTLEMNERSFIFQEVVDRKKAMILERSLFGVDNNDPDNEIFDAYVFQIANAKINLNCFKTKKFGLEFREYTS